MLHRQVCYCSPVSKFFLIFVLRPPRIPSERGATFMPSHHRAFTLIPLLPLLPPSPLRIPLLRPALQAAREAARRAQCVNNVKQILLGMHNFESANGTLPKGINLPYANGYTYSQVSDSLVADHTEPFGPNWAVMILPY